jgi:hypothetical protein
MIGMSVALAKAAADRVEGRRGGTTLICASQAHRRHPEQAH